MIGSLHERPIKANPHESVIHVTTAFSQQYYTLLYTSLFKN